FESRFLLGARACLGLLEPHALLSLSRIALGLLASDALGFFPGDPLGFLTRSALGLFTGSTLRLLERTPLVLFFGDAIRFEVLELRKGNEGRILGIHFVRFSLLACRQKHAR